jgi:aminoglycoside N3'-acetyltransferase
LVALTQRARSWVRKRRGRTLRKRRAAMLAAHGAVSPAEIAGRLSAMGVARGDTVFLQVSVKDMVTFAGNVHQLLSAMSDLLGPDGTLLMPAYTDPGTAAGEAVFDPETAPTYTGIANEIFRRSPDVVRSLHPRHSICGRGRLARELLDGHEKCFPADGADSPFDRLRSIDRAWIVTLGLPPAYVSFLHWVEDIDPGRFPVAVHQRQPAVRRVRSSVGSVLEVRDLELESFVGSRLDLSRVARQLSSQAMQHESHRGIDLGVYRVSTLAAELLALRDRGIVHYR